MVNVDYPIALGHGTLLQAMVSASMLIGVVNPPLYACQYAAIRKR